jgi:ankyrin repeat protein
MASLLIQSGIDINIQSSLGLTALHRACQRGVSDIVSLLVSSGANVDIVNEEGEKAPDIGVCQHPGVITGTHTEL